MLQVDVTAQVRTNFGKGAARSLRRSGHVPAILYGAKSDTLALSLNTRSFTKTLLELQRRNAVVTLDVEGAGKRHVLIKEIQVDPVQDTLKHADFCEIALDVPSVFAVPINYTGKAAGVEMGGVMAFAMRSLSLQANPLDIPDSIDIDISSLNIGDSLSCKDMQIPGNVTLLDDENKTCISVVESSGILIDEDEEEVVAEEAAVEAEAAE